MRNGVIITDSNWNDLSDAATFPAWHFYTELNTEIEFRIWANIPKKSESSDIRLIPNCLLWTPHHGINLLRFCIGIPFKGHVFPTEIQEACEKADIIVLFTRGGNLLVDTIARRWGYKTISHPTDNNVINCLRSRHLRFACKSWLELLHLSLQRLRGIVFVSELDRDHYAKWLPWSRAPAYAIPLGVDTDIFYPRAYDTRHVHKTCRFAFIGDLGYFPNTEACKFIIEHILPHLSCSSKIIFGGRRPPDFLLALADNDARIKVSGYVEDIVSIYHESDVMIAPIFHGSGMQNKLLEASACGLPCITTSVCAAAFKILPPNFLVADHLVQILDYVSCLSKNPEMRHKLGEAGRMHICENYSWRARAKSILQLAAHC